MRILVVDDEPAVREAVERALRLDGHDVLVAADGHEALGALDERPPDAVVLDVLMPRVDALGCVVHGPPHRQDAGVRPRRGRMRGGLHRAASPPDPLASVERTLVPARRLCLLVALITAAMASPASATAPRDGQGFAIADDVYFGFPNDPHGFLVRAEDWYGPSFASLDPAAFRFQISWNADQALIDRAKMLVDYVRRQGVTQVVVSFKKNGAVPDAAAYGASIGQVMAQLAGYVDVWGPANEPNLGDTWLPGAAGAWMLAQYWAHFSAAVVALDPTALTLSPEFADRRDLGSIGSYLSAYAKAGGGFGDIVGWHPYWGTHAMTRSTTDDLLQYAPPDLPVWVTEVGAWGGNAHGSPPIEDGELAQNRRLDWLANDPNGLAAHPRVTQIHHYHMRDSGQPDWDSALVRVDGRRRPAWYTWCYASRGDDPRRCDQSPWGLAAGVLGPVRQWLRSASS